MTTRVDQLALNVRKLAQATGVEGEKKDRHDPGLDGVTSDLDIEALSKGLLDASRDLDLYLQGLVNPPDLAVVTVKQDIANLTTELQEKDEMIEKTVETIKKAEATFRKLKQRHATRSKRHVKNKYSLQRVAKEGTRTTWKTVKLVIPQSNSEYIVRSVKAAIEYLRGVYLS